MSKLFIEEATLKAIGDAIRAKAVTTELIPPQNMGEAITNIPAGESLPDANEVSY